MGEVKQYDAVHIRYEDRNIRYGEGCEVKMVAAQDYDALRAENEQLRKGMTGDYDLDAWLDWCKEADKLRAENAELVAALDRLFSSYKMLADSGDAGNWSLEALPEGMQAMEALAKYRVDGKLVTSCYN